MFCLKFLVLHSPLPCPPSFTKPSHQSSNMECFSLRTLQNFQCEEPQDHVLCHTSLHCSVIAWACTGLFSITRLRLLCFLFLFSSELCIRVGVDVGTPWIWRSLKRFSCWASLERWELTWIHLCSSRSLLGIHSHFLFPLQEWSVSLRKLYCLPTMPARCPHSWLPPALGSCSPDHG